MDAFEIASGVARVAARPIERWEGIPVRISHIVLHSPKHAEAVRFFTEVLGFRVSDWLGDFMCFLRCNSAHHRLAILPGPPCLTTYYDMRTSTAAARVAGCGARHRRALGPGGTAGDNTFSSSSPRRLHRECRRTGEWFEPTSQVYAPLK
jgi:catechol 2,3-dioxygenase-like lactoylglutathione lyase family enzyme